MKLKLGEKKSKLSGHHGQDGQHVRDRVALVCVCESENAILVITISRIAVALTTNKGHVVRALVQMKRI